MFYFENKDLEIKEVKKGLMHHMKEVTALQKQMTAMVNIVEGRVAQILINPLTPERAYTRAPKYGVHFAPKRD